MNHLGKIPTMSLTELTIPLARRFDENEEASCVRRLQEGLYSGKGATFDDI